MPQTFYTEDEYMVLVNDISTLKANLHIAEAGAKINHATGIQTKAITQELNAERVQALWARLGASNQLAAICILDKLIKFYNDKTSYYRG